MTMVVLYDDLKARRFEPYASTRPVSEMVAGTSLIRERWKIALQPTKGAQFVAGPRMVDFEEGDETSPAIGVIPAGSIVANARCVPAFPSDIARAAERAASCSLWRCGEEVAAVRLRSPLDASAFDDGSLTLDELHAGTGAIAEIPGWWHNEVWDFIRHLGEQLTSDVTIWSQQEYNRARLATYKPPAHTTVIGDYPVVVLGDDAVPGMDPAIIEPHVVLDASAGPIMISTGAHIRAFSRINGPCYIGRGTTVLGGEVSGSSIGETCKVRGELSSSIAIGHSNKGHDGFVGHSYLGRWVNLGAGTTTSNLKNTYGTVALWTPTGVRDTGLQFLGTLFGDHVKTGIGLRLTTGSVLGAGANVYDAMPPKTVAPFSWGGGAPYATYRADKFIETAARMMSRRHIELSERDRRHLAAVHAGRWTVETDAL
jgi:UDP-N-acetylglucosamine diphosphorylase/glucosamine-1-phosphate N-acetyltransferase